MTNATMSLFGPGRDWTPKEREEFIQEDMQRDCWNCGGTGTARPDDNEYITVDCWDCKGTGKHSRETAEANADLEEPMK